MPDSSQPDLSTPAARRQLQAAILKWYQSHSRIFPWRDSSDPYRIWISEIMLQQTTVTTVVPFFTRFMIRFPDIKSLAAADEEDVLRHWEGLGYYSRARNLHKAARMIVSDHDGNVPDNLQSLQQLPGIGRYTAGAIASFAFQLPAPILEANTLRLYARLLNLQLDPKSSAGQKVLWSFAESIVSKKRPADFNQAVMDLGSTVCTPRHPDCSQCPVSQWCGAFHHNSQDQIPLETPRAPKTDITDVSVAVCHQDQVLLRQRTAGEWWSGLWDFARFRVAPESADLIPPFPRSQQITIVGRKLQGAPKSSARIRGNQKSLFSDEITPEQFFPDAWKLPLSELLGQTVSSISPLTEFRHVVTRYRIRLLCYTAMLPEPHLDDQSEFHWFPIESLKSMPLSQPARRQAVMLLKWV